MEKGKLSKRVFTKPDTGGEKLVSHAPLDLTLTCSICKRRCVVRTTSLGMYTPAVRKHWTCILHSEAERKQHREATKMNQEVSQATGDERMVTQEEVKTIVQKLQIPSNWRTELLERYYASSKGLTVFLMDVEAVINDKTRVKSGGDLEKRKEEMRARAKKVIDKILTASDKKPEAEKKDETPG